MTDDRLGVFVSALEQSEQLMHAAQEVGAAARPLPLFYALSQAGRAIAAARLDDPWRLAGHGLTHPPQDNVTDLLRRRIGPQQERRRTGMQDRRGAFQGVSEAVGSDPPTQPIELGAIWAAVPDLVEPLPQIPRFNRAWRRPLRAHFVERVGAFAMQGMPLELLLEGLPLPPDDADALLAELAHYPTAGDAAVRTASGGIRPVVNPQDEGPTPALTAITPTGNRCPWFLWPNRKGVLFGYTDDVDEVAPVYGNGRLVLPEVGPGTYLSPLMLWWVLLFGLSSITRYDPELWIAALDLNSSEQAVPIEAALDRALDALPDLILDALTSGQSDTTCSGEGDDPGG